MNNISLILLTKNEEENIRNNFNWLKECPVIDEIVVVDDDSDDDTIKILQSLKRNNLKIKIISHNLNNDFSVQRNLAISNTKNDWILWLDADEIPDTQLIDFLNKSNFCSDQSYAFKREDIFLGYKLQHGETANQYFIRLFHKKEGKIHGKVHEVWISKSRQINTDQKIFHHSHKSLKTLLTKINFYSTIRSEELYQQGTKSNIFQIICYPFGKFLYNYILRLGFLDSTPGIIIALAMSLHSFLVRAKLWHLQQK